MDELIAGPELDRRVCEILGIDPDGGETFDPSDPVYPCVSTDPATIPVVMEAIAKKIGAGVSVGYFPHTISTCNWQAYSFTVNRDHWATAPNLALCGLAVKLGEK